MITSATEVRSMIVAVRSVPFLFRSETAFQRLFTGVARSRQYRSAAGTRRRRSSATPMNATVKSAMLKAMGRARTPYVVKLSANPISGETTSDMPADSAMRSMPPGPFLRG